MGSSARAASRPAVPPSPFSDRVGYSDHVRFRGYVSVHCCSGLQPPCLRFATAVTGRHARLGSRLLARLCRGRHRRRQTSTRLQGATLIELDRQISRIQLSDKTSRLHPRQVVPKPAQAYEPKVPVKMREWIGPALATPGFVLELQPPAQPHRCVAVERPIRPADGAYLEVVRPSAQRAVLRPSCLPRKIRVPVMQTLRGGPPMTTYAFQNATAEQSPGYSQSAGIFSRVRDWYRGFLPHWEQQKP
jgi:hypothetical protein